MSLSRGRSSSLVRARGLAGATGIAVSSDGKYVHIISGSGGSLAIYELMADGTLVLDQVLRGTPR